MPSPPWISWYDPGIPTDLAESPHGLYDLLATVVQRFPDSTACAYFGRDISYWRLKNLCDAFATALYRREFGPRKRVALLLPNCPQFVISLLGSLRAGAAVVPLPPDISEAELAAVLEAIPCHLAVVLDSQLALIKTVAPKLPLVVSSLRDFLPPPLKLLYPRQGPAGASLRTLAEEADTPFLRFVKRSRPLNFLLERPSPEAVLFVDDALHPHAAAFTSVALATNAHQLAAWPGRVLKRGREKLLAAHPLYRIDGLVGCVGLGLATAACVILTSRVFAEDITAALTTYQPDILVGPASLFEELSARATPLPPRRPSIRCLRWALSTRGTLSAATRKTLEDLSDAGVVEAYVTSQTGYSHATPLLRHVPGDGVWLPLPGVDSRVTSGLAAVAPGEWGTLAISGPAVMSHWVPDPPGSGVELADAWVYTGAAAAMTPSGQFNLSP